MLEREPPSTVAMDIAAIGFVHKFELLWAGVEKQSISVVLFQLITVCTRVVNEGNSINLEDAVVGARVQIEVELVPPRLFHVCSIGVAGVDAMNSRQEYNYPHRVTPWVRGGVTYTSSHAHASPTLCLSSPYLGAFGLVVWSQSYFLPSPYGSRRRAGAKFAGRGNSLTW